MNVTGRGRVVLFVFLKEFDLVLCHSNILGWLPLKRHTQKRRGSYPNPKIML